MKILKIILLAALILVCIAYGATSIYSNTSGEDIAPQIVCPQETLELSVDHTVGDLLAGLTASDQQDGDLTDQIIVAGVSKLLTADTAKVSYLVFDSDNNMASCTRTLRYTDYARPVIEVAEPLVFASRDSAAIIEKLRAADVIDGDLSGSVRISSLRTTEDPEVLAVTAMVTNSMGDTTSVLLPVIITSADPSLSTIALTEQLITLDRGASFDARDYLVSGSGVSIDDPVDTSLPGTYWVTYRQSADGQSALAILTVIVA